jgi:hypothetical protein
MTRQRGLLVLLVAVSLALGLTWVLRWQIGSGAFEIAEPAVRRWVIAEVGRLSDNVYDLQFSPITVHATDRRIAVDSLHLITNRSANEARARPLPILDLRFHGCAFERIDLDGLAAGRGLHVERVGCDSVIATADVPPGVRRDTAGTGSFLSLRGDLALPEDVPMFQIDSVQFPDVRLGLRIEGDDGNETVLSLQHLAFLFDSLGYDPRIPSDQRPTLLSRNVFVRLALFEGAREGADRLLVRALEANLVDGSIDVDSIAWSPMPGVRADSLGLTGFALDSLAVRGMDWRPFLTTGGVAIRSIATHGLRIGTRPSRGGGAAPVGGASDRWTLERSLRALRRSVRVDTFTAGDVVVDHGGADAPVARTTVRAVHLTGVASDPGPSAWSGTEPAGPIRLAAAGVVHAWRDYRATLDSLQVDLPARFLEVRNLHYGTVGTDGQFARRRPYRTDRVTVDLTRLRVRGLEGAHWIRTAGYRATNLLVEGFRLDVLSDQTMPASPTVASHRTPQGWLRTVPVAVQLDSATIVGGIRYRERHAESGIIGELHFDDLRAQVARFATGAPTRGNSPPIGFLATTRLMGEGPLQLQVTLPRSPGFAMEWSGRLGSMQAAALNRMLIGATDLAFETGLIEWVEFDAETHDGLSTGVVRPRYRDLKVSMPGVARSGALGGVRRAIAGMVANTFVVRGDNPAGAEDGSADGTISHGWSPQETLIQHLWFALREGLKQVVLP